VPKKVATKVPEPPRYGVGKNRALRHVLCEVWETRCYWCKRYKDYLDLQIDHILPRKATKKQRERLTTVFGLPDGFDVDAVYNLAPICADCNVEKRAKDLTTLPVVATRLDEARAAVDEVAIRYERLGKATRLGGALLTAASADLENPDVRATFEQAAPAIARRLSELDPRLLDFVRTNTVWVDLDDRLILLDTAFNESSRKAVGVLEDLVGVGQETWLVEPLTDLVHQLAGQMQDELGSIDDGEGSPVVGPPNLEVHRVTITAVSMTVAVGGDFTFEFAGDFEVSASASISRSSADGGELEDVQGDGEATGRFAFDLSWSPSSATVVEFDRVWVDDETNFETWLE